MLTVIYYYATLNFCLNLELPGEDESDASVPIQGAEDIVEDDISSRAGNLVGPSMGAEATSDVTSTEPVKLVDLQRILSNIGGGGSSGLGLGDILRPELIRPLLQELTVDQELASYLPEGKTCKIFNCYMLDEAR